MRGDFLEDLRTELLLVEIGADGSGYGAGRERVQSLNLMNRKVSHLRPMHDRGGFVSLVSLDLSYCRIRDVGLQEFGKFPALEALNLSFNGLNRAQLAAVLGGLEACHRLRRLWLGGMDARAEAVFCHLRGLEQFDDVENRHSLSEQQRASIERLREWSHGALSANYLAEVDLVRACGRAGLRTGPVRQVRVLIALLSGDSPAVAWPQSCSFPCSWN